jgi:ComF family protein
LVQNLNFNLFNTNSLRYQSCITCDKQVNKNSTFCEACYRQIHFISNSCQKCGEPQNSRITRNICLKCISKNNWHLDVVKSIFLYKNIGRDLIINLKQKNSNYIYNKLTNLICNDQEFFYSIDIIIPIPLHWIKKFLRGFDQSIVLAENISVRTKIEIKKNILYKKINTKAQHTRQSKDRFTNVENSFIIKNHNIIENKNILLIDDVITTGATSNECAKLLKLHNAKSVKLITLARTIL